MTTTVQVGRKELTSAEVEAGNRVVIEVEMVGTTARMAIRNRAELYYCDTPIKLLTYESEEELQHCLERDRLATCVEGSSADEVTWNG